MKILHTVESYPPLKTGMAEVVRQISERLQQKNHEVHIATQKSNERKESVLNGVYIHEFDVTGNYSRGIKGESDEYRKFLLENDFDIITNFAAQIWTTDLCLDLLPQLKAKKVFVPTGFSGLYLPDYRKYYKKIKLWMLDYNMSVFLSEEYRDINFARKYSIKNITLISNGADEREFLNDSSISIREKYNIKSDEFLILHVGSFTGLKGHSEAIKIFSKADIDNAVLLMIGNESNGRFVSRIKSIKKMCADFNEKNKTKRIILTSEGREETVAAFKEADLFLFPSNIECSPIVLFEAMASKTPFLVTDAGNSSEIVYWSKSGIILPTIKFYGFSRALINKSVKILSEIYHDKSKRESMKESGYNAWLNNFTWEKIAKKYEQLYLDLLNN